MTREQQTAIVDKALAQLGEHFDSVQIFATVKADDGDGTVRISKGCGDYFARYGLVNYWLQLENADASNSVNDNE